MLLVFLLSLSNGITENMIKLGTTLSTGHVNVAGFFKPSQTTPSPLVTNCAGVRKIVEENTPNLAYVLDRGRGWAKLVSETGPSSRGSPGSTRRRRPTSRRRWCWRRRARYRRGRERRAQGRPVQARHAGVDRAVRVPGEEARGPRGRRPDADRALAPGANNSADVTIVAICEDIGLLSTFSMFTAKQTGQTCTSSSTDTTGAMQIYLKDIDDSDNTMEHLRGVLEKKGYRLMDHDPNPFFVKIPQVQGDDWLGQKLDITTWHDEVSSSRRSSPACNWCPHRSSRS